VGGMSWAAPYLAGLAAMALQLDGAINPDTIVELPLNTSTKTKVGPVVNPGGFIEAVKSRTRSAQCARCAVRAQPQMQGCPLAACGYNAGVRRIMYRGADWQELPFLKRMIW